MSVYPQTEQKPIVSAIKRNETAIRNFSPPLANRFPINLSFCSFDFVIPKTQRGQKGNLFSPEPTSKPRSRWDHNQDQNQLQSHDKTRCAKSVLWRPKFSSVELISQDVPWLSFWILSSVLSLNVLIDHFCTIYIEGETLNQLFFVS